MVERIRSRKYADSGSNPHKPRRGAFGNPNGTRGGSKPGNPTGRKGGSRPGNPNGKRGGMLGTKGKPWGNPNKASKDQIAEARAGGEDLPHEFMLRVTRANVGDVLREHIITWEDIQWACQTTANYYAARLSSVRVDARNMPAPVLQLEYDKVQSLTEEELAVAEKLFGRLRNQLPGPAITLGPDEYEATLQ